MHLPVTLGELKEAGYQSRNIKRELKENLIAKLQSGKPIFADIVGYDYTVIPDLKRAILAGHHINLLGLRGQAKTRLARMMVGLLDEYIPVVAGSEINDDPFHPLSQQAKTILAEQGDATAISWLHRDERYVEKLATPDVSIADLIGDVDPVKAANLRLSYADERVLHFGLIPRSNRCIFVINELPDLQAKIQVALFNILQEGDIQIRGFKVRWPLDIQFIFTANPEDYTSRGSIVTPLKDRIGSQILTHYPEEISQAMRITKQEAKTNPGVRSRIHVPALADELLEQISFEARKSEYVDARSGVSARLSISAYELMMSAAELRMASNREKQTSIRMQDIYSIIPAITGKVELVYEGEQEGAGLVAHHLISTAIRTVFGKYFASLPSSGKKSSTIYSDLIGWFDQGNTIDLIGDVNEATYRQMLEKAEPLKETVSKSIDVPDQKDIYFLMEFLLHALAGHSRLTKYRLENGSQFRDLMSSVFGDTHKNQP